MSNTAGDANARLPYPWRPEEVKMRFARTLGVRHAEMFG